MRTASDIFLDDADGNAKRACSLQRPIPTRGPASPTTPVLTRPRTRRAHLRASHPISRIEFCASDTRNAPDVRALGYHGACVRMQDTAYTCIACPAFSRRNRSVRLSIFVPHSLLTRTCQTPCSAATDPFSSHAFLPLVAALDRIVERFAAQHLVRYTRQLPSRDRTPFIR